ncbi:MAG: AMP-binding protein [Magnetococcales bacterium]|nr:AMP-binding protein [Magnetococcales bacterium]MBF0151501.1 AMP-binding protein [Magnetococcales bacterium]
MNRDRAILPRLLKRCFRMRIQGLEHLPGRMVAVNRRSRWDWMILAPFLDQGSWIILPPEEIPTKLHFLLFRGTRFIPEDQLEFQSLSQHLQQGHTALFFPEPLAPAMGRFRKITFLPNAAVPHAVLALEGTEAWPWSQRKRPDRCRHWFPRLNISVIPLNNDLPPNPRHLQDGLGQAILAQSLGSTLWDALIQSSLVHGHRRIILEDENGQRLRYQTLFFKSILLSQLLESHTQPGECVGLMLPTTLAAVVSFFALQIGGRIPAMLNFSAGPDTVRVATRMARVRLVVTARQFVQKARLHDLVATLAEELNILYLEDLKPAVTPGMLLHAAWYSLVPHKKILPPAKPGDTAVLLFTSGSEGTPKGVVLSHGNLLANVQQILTRFDLSTDDVFLNVLPLFHAFGLTVGTLAPLMAGAKVFCHPAVLDYRAVPRIAWNISATILAGTDTFLKGYGRMADPVDFASLRHCFAGAEPLRNTTHTLWLEKFGIRILEGYGATETAPVLAVNIPEACRFGSVGRLLPGVEWRLEPIPGIEEGGRLWVHGPNVMQGYLRIDAPGVLHPLPTEENKTWYDTGDVVRVDDEGFLWILGRAKRFAKIGGEMVSLATVETVAMEAWPEGIHGVVMVADPRKGETLVLITSDHTINRRDFVNVLKERGLSLLLLPGRIIHHDPMPMLASGKLDLVQLEHLARESAIIEIPNG